MMYYNMFLLTAVVAARYSITFPTAFVLDNAASFASGFVAANLSSVRSHATFCLATQQTYIAVVGYQYECMMSTTDSASFSLSLSHYLCSLSRLDRSAVKLFLFK